MMSFIPLFTHDVTPAQAGIHSCFHSTTLQRVDSRLRWNDAVELAESEPSK